MEKTVLGAAVVTSPSIAAGGKPSRMAARAVKDDISLAQWSLVDEVRAGKWKTIDFAKIAREDFGLNGIEYVNTLFEVPTEDYLKKLKKNAEDHNVTSVLIMVDEEGDGCMPTKEGRRQFEINHRKWIDAAHYLGCTSIRTNCRGPETVNKTEALKWAVESYNFVGILYWQNKCFMRHGGVSNALTLCCTMKEVANLYSEPSGLAPNQR